MEQLVALIQGVTRDEETLQLVFTSTVALAIFIVGFAALLLAAGAANPIRRRVQRMYGERGSEDTRSHSVTKLLGTATPYIVPKVGKERSRISRKLIQAGYRDPSSLTTFFAVKILLAIVLPTLVLLVASQFPDLTSAQMAVGVGGAGFLGMTLPNIILNRLYEKRMRLLRNGFPDALDLLVVCVEAGLGLAAAIKRVSEEIVVSHPQLAEELALVNAEIRAGVERTEALKNLADRTGLEDIRGLVSLLAQSLRFGTSIAETLRVYSEEFRDKRLQLAEELAAKIGTKLIFPLVLCLFPSFFLVAVGPALFGVFAALGIR